LFQRRATVAPTLVWIEKHFDALGKQLPTFVGGRMPWVGPGLCDEVRVREAEAFFRARRAKIEGADKHLHQAVEVGKPCAAFGAAQGARFDQAL
jgi:hypothetical protein